MEHTIVGANRAAFFGNAGENVGYNVVPAVGGPINQLIGLQFNGLDIPTDPAILDAQIGLDGGAAGDDRDWSIFSGDITDPNGYFDVLDFDITDILGADRFAALPDTNTASHAMDSPSVYFVWIERLDSGHVSSPSQESARRAHPDEQFDPDSMSIDQPGDPTPVIDPPASEADSQGGDPLEQDTN